MIENIITISFNAFVVICIFNIICYLPRIRCWFGSIRKQKRITNNTNNRIAVIIPARNESKVIETLFNSLMQQTYDKDFFDVHVIVKNASDPTIALTKAINGTPYIITDQTCKGDALDACLKTILSNKSLHYDAYLIIDADCLLENDFLEQMNNGLASGCQVIQAKRVVKNYISQNKKANNWVTCSNGLIWTIIDTLGNRYKSDHKITNMTIGTGIMIRHDVIKELNGWPYRKTLTEDIEFMNDCAIKGFSTFYYSYARIYMEESPSIKETNKRRTRWLTGVIDSKRLYDEKLKENSETILKKRNRYFVTGLTPAFRYIGVCVIFALFYLSLSLFSLAFYPDFFSLLIFLSFICISIIYVSFLILTLFCIISDYHDIKIPFYKKILLLFIHPAFYMGYIPIIARALISKNNNGWEEIERLESDIVNL